MNSRRQHRLELLRRLREMHVEQARADHVAAQAELEEKRQIADDTQRRLAALDDWTAGQMAGGASLLPEVLHQARLFRHVETQTLENQRVEEEASRQRTEVARGTLARQFEELSVAERLGERQRLTHMNELLRRGYVDLDEAGAQKKNLESKE